MSNRGIDQECKYYAVDKIALEFDPFCHCTANDGGTVSAKEGLKHKEKIAVVARGYVNQKEVLRSNKAISFSKGEAKSECIEKYNRHGNIKDVLEKNMNRISLCYHASF